MIHRSLADVDFQERLAMAAITRRNVRNVEESLKRYLAEDRPIEETEQRIAVFLTSRGGGGAPLKVSESDLLGRCAFTKVEGELVISCVRLQ